MSFIHSYHEKHIYKTHLPLKASSSLDTNKKSDSITKIANDSLNLTDSDDSSVFNAIQFKSSEIEGTLDELPPSLLIKNIIPIIIDNPEKPNNSLEILGSPSSETTSKESLDSSPKSEISEDLSQSISISSPDSSSNTRLITQAEAVHHLALEILQPTNDIDISSLIELSEILLTYDQSEESFNELLNVIAKILPESSQQTPLEFLESLQKKAILENDFSILTNPYLEILSKEDFEILERHLLGELKDTQAFFEMVLATNSETDPDKKRLLIKTLNQDAKKFILDQASIGLCRDSFFKPVTQLIQQISRDHVDLSQVRDLTLLSRQRKNWTKSTPSDSSKIHKFYTLKLGELGEGSVNTVQLVWDSHNSLFFAMRQLKIAPSSSRYETTEKSPAYTKIERGIKKTEAIFKACSFNDHIAAPGILVEGRQRENSSTPYASLEEVATHRDLAIQIPLFQTQPRLLLKQLLQQTIALQESGVALGDIKPANINVYQVNEKIILKYSDLDGSKTKESLILSLEENWNTLCEKLHNDPDKIKQVLQNLSQSLLMDNFTNDETDAAISFKSSVLNLTDTFVSPGYSFGSRELTLNFMQLSTRVIFKKLSEINPQEFSSLEFFSSVADDIISSLQKLDLRCLGSSLLEVLTPTSLVTKPYLYRLLRLSSQEQLTPMELTLSSKTPPKPLRASSSSQKGNTPQNNPPTNLPTINPFAKGSYITPPIKKAPTQASSSHETTSQLPPIQTHYQIAETLSIENIHEMLQRGMESFLMTLPEGEKLPSETPNFVLDLINGKISNDKSGAARIQSFIDQL